MLGRNEGRFNGAINGRGGRGRFGIGCVDEQPNKYQGTSEPAAKMKIYPTGLE